MDVRRILVARLDNLGDVLLATPAIHALRRALPRTRITLFASSIGAQLAGLNPDIDDILIYAAPWMDPERTLAHDPSREASTIAEIRRRGYDGAIIFTSYHQSSLPAAYLCYLAGVPLRHAASVDGPGSLLTSRHRPPPRAMHEVERGLDLVGGLGIPPAEDDLVLRPRDADTRSMRGFVQTVRERNGGGPVLVLHPGCSCPSRTYPPALFAKAGAALRRSLGASLLWTGRATEAELVTRIQEGVRAAGADDAGLSLAGKTDLSQLAALIGACDGAITNNSGPAHVAAAMKTPVAVLFALTNPPGEWHPWKVPHRLLYHPVPCAICYQRVCPFEHDCLRQVTADQIVHAVAELLAGGSESEYRPRTGEADPP